MDYVQKRKFNKKKISAVDTLHLRGGGGVAFLQNFMSLLFMVWEKRYFEDFEDKDDLVR